MHNRWLALVAVASLCLNAAVVGTYLFRQAGHRRSHHRQAALRPELREQMQRLRDESWPEFQAEAAKAESIDSILWANVGGKGLADSEVDSLCRELGSVHGRLRAMVFRTVSRELELMPPDARAEHLKAMRPAPGMRRMFGGPGKGMGRHMGRGMGPGGPPPGFGPPMGGPPPGPEVPPESGE